MLRTHVYHVRMQYTICNLCRKSTYQTVRHESSFSPALMSLFPDCAVIGDIDVTTNSQMPDKLYVNPGALLSGGRRDSWG